MIATQGSKNPKMNKNFFGEVPFFLKTCLLEVVRTLKQTRLGVDKVKPKGWFKYF